jgi:hypothetical protein
MTAPRPVSRRVARAWNKLRPRPGRATKFTRAAAKAWFVRTHPGIPIERHDPATRTFFVAHHPALVCARYGAWQFVNAHQDPDRAA